MDLDESFSSESSVDSDEEVNIFCIYIQQQYILPRDPKNIDKLWKTHLAQQLAVGVLLLN